MQSRSIVGVLVGGVVDIVATNLLSIPLLIYIAATRDLGGIQSAEFGDRIVGVMRESAGVQTAGWFLGLCGTVIGGYVAARIARRTEIRHGALSGWLCMSLGVYGLLTDSGAAPVWQHLLAFVLSPTFGAFGGFLRLRQLRRGHGGGSGALPLAVSS